MAKKTTKKAVKAPADRAKAKATKEAGQTIEHNLAAIEAEEAASGASGETKAETASDDVLSAKTRRPKKTPGETAGKKLSAIDAAAKLLGDSHESMTTKAMVEAMAAQGLWTSPGGKTPAATLHSAILREIQIKGLDSRFKKTDRGQFAATSSEATR